MTNKQLFEEIYNLATDVDYLNVPDNPNKYEMAKNIIRKLQSTMNKIAITAKEGVENET